ncbi:hypothetical protein [Flavobacterium sp. 7A]|uniref:hypothetical protein n=1 Tax=Flavobacterium sp. 7A TaxID=2940571 RepID=UPI002227D735|nr:hypothetical protein [Flavobacterium sp. 7A]MCW2119086.1 hypothetical protein [Flavobacterium sp. 7A]
MRLKLTIISFLFFAHSFSQTINNSDKINSYIESYFRLDRENIHVQFNKNTYVNNEDIGFKGYVLSKNNGKLNTNTTNVQLVVYDNQEQIVLKQLLFTSKGTFAGGIHLTDKFKSGIYHFHFYTNWMNNFNEDDSFTQKIEIIDKSEPYNLKTTEPNYKTAQVTFFPEGGLIIDAINNTIGVKIVDCNQKGIEVEGISIVDSKLNEITKLNTNKMGNGSFYFIPETNESYTLKIKTDKIDIQQPLPKISETGLTLSYNNNLPKNIIAVAIKTNEKGLETYKGKKYTILIHQDGNSIQKELTLKGDETEQVLLFDKKFLSNGVNSIRLLDENLNEITERLVYKYATQKAQTTLEAKAIANDSIILLGKTNTKQAQLSISVLPHDNINLAQNKSIMGTFYLNAYLENPENDNYIYFDQNNKNQKQDMELLMLNQHRSKFLWNNIKANPPKINYKFNKGVTISGKVEKNTSGNSKYRISLISLKNSVFEETAIDQNSDFKFENFFAQDSTVFLLQMINEKSAVKFTKMEARVTPNESKFMLPLRFEKDVCPLEKKPETSFSFSKSPFDGGAVDLAGVTIQNTFKKDVFTHKSDMSINATAFKIDDTEFGNVLDFIGRNGFKTGIDPEENTAYIRNSRDAFSDNPPAVYLDNAVVFDYNLLYSLDLNDVDEIYIDKSGASDTSASSSGTIKIFLKIGSDKNDYFRAKYTSLIVTTGFTKNIEFKNASFESQKEYFYFGTLNWTPTIEIKENPNYELRFPKTGQTEIKVLIEGMAADGQPISEIQTIPVQ